MCSAFIARVVRTAVPDDVPVSVMYPGADIEAFRPDLPFEDLPERHGVADRPRRRLRQPARRAQGPGRADPRDARDPPSRPRRRAADRGGRAVPRAAGARSPRTAPAGSVVFTGQVSEADLPRYYRAGDVFAMPCRTRLGGPRGRGLGQRVHRGGGVRAPGGRRRLGRRTRVARGRRDRPARRRAGTSGRSPRPSARCSRTPPAPTAMGAAGRDRVERRFTWPGPRSSSPAGCARPGLVRRATLGPGARAAPAGVGYPGRGTMGDTPSAARAAGPSVAPTPSGAASATRSLRREGPPRRRRRPRPTRLRTGSPTCPAPAGGPLGQRPRPAADAIEVEGGTAVLGLPGLRRHATAIERERAAASARRRSRDCSRSRRSARRSTRGPPRCGPWRSPGSDTGGSATGGRCGVARFACSPGRSGRCCPDPRVAVRQGRARARRSPCSSCTSVRRAGGLRAVRGGRPPPVERSGAAGRELPDAAVVLRRAGPPVGRRWRRSSPCRPRVR